MKETGHHEQILATAQALRWELGPGFHDTLAGAIYQEAERLAGRAVTRPGDVPRFDWDRAVDRMVTSRVWGFPLMLLLFTLVFWLTISGANLPSSWLSALLVDRLHTRKTSAEYDDGVWL